MLENFREIKSRCESEQRLEDIGEFRERQLGFERCGFGDRILVGLEEREREAVGLERENQSLELIV